MEGNDYHRVLGVFDDARSRTIDRVTSQSAGPDHLDRYFRDKESGQTCKLKTSHYTALLQPDGSKDLNLWWTADKECRLPAGIARQFGALARDVLMPAVQRRLNICAVRHAGVVQFTCLVTSSNYSLELS